MSPTDPGGKPGGSKTAKKGCKKLVLFSTGGQRRIWQNFTFETPPPNKKLKKILENITSHS